MVMALTPASRPSSEWTLGMGVFQFSRRCPTHRSVAGDHDTAAIGCRLGQANAALSIHNLSRSTPYLLADDWTADPSRFMTARHTGGSERARKSTAGSNTAGASIPQ